MNLDWLKNALDGIGVTDSITILKNIERALQEMTSSFSDRLVSVSRAANELTDNGATLELENGVTYTLDGNVALPAGVIWIGPETGSSTIACINGALINGASTSITISAGMVRAAIPRRSDPKKFVIDMG